jgi:hypothetical protein
LKKKKIRNDYYYDCNAIENADDSDYCNRNDYEGEDEQRKRLNEQDKKNCHKNKEQ